jgi:hypothetical protein
MESCFQHDNKYSDSISEEISLSLITVGGFWKQRQEKVNIFVPLLYIQKEFRHFSCI